jgi:hypothetical protein
MVKNAYEFSVEELEAVCELYAVFNEEIRFFKSMDVDEVIEEFLAQPQFKERMILQVKALLMGITSPLTVEGLDQKILSKSTVRRILQTQIAASLIEEKTQEPPEKPMLQQLVLRRSPKDLKKKELIDAKKKKWKRPLGRPSHIFITQPWLVEYSRTGDINAWPWSTDIKKFICKAYLYFIDCGILKKLKTSRVNLIIRFFRSEKALEFFKSFFLEIESIDPRLKGKLWSERMTSQDFEKLASKMEKTSKSEKPVDLELKKLKSKLTASLLSLEKMSA